jgi:hypothetical protein
LCWYAERAAQCFALLEQVIPENRLARILGSQCGNPWVTQRMLKFLADTNLAQHIDGIAVAPYVGDGITKAASLDDLFQQMATSLNQIVNTWLPGHFKAAGNLPIVCYEGGDGTPTQKETTGFETLVAQAAGDARMGTLYTTLLNSLQQLGVKAFVHYQNTEQQNVAAGYPGFGAQAYLGQTPVTPKLAALRKFAGVS